MASILCAILCAFRTGPQRSATRTNQRLGLEEVTTQALPVRTRPEDDERLLPRQ